MKKAVLIAFVIFLGFSVFASVSYTPAIQIYAGGAFCCPTADYLKYSQGKKLPALRTSFNAGTDLLPLNFCSGQFEFGAGFSVLYVSNSLVAGIQYLRQYLAYGPAINFAFNWNVFGLALKGRLLWARFVPLKDKFAAGEAEIMPFWKVTGDNSFRVKIILPLTVQFKKDAVTFRVSAGVDLSFKTGSGRGVK